MLQPARTKYRKMQKGRMPGKAYRGSKLTFGEFGLMTTQPGWLTSRQIDELKAWALEWAEDLGARIHDENA